MGQGAPEPVYQLKPTSQHQQYNYKQEGTYGPTSAGSSGSRTTGSSTNLIAPPQDQIDIMAREYEVKKLGS